MHWYVLRIIYVCWNKNMKMIETGENADRIGNNGRTEKDSWYGCQIFDKHQFLDFIKFLH